MLQHQSLILYYMYISDYRCVSEATKSIPCEVFNYRSVYRNNQYICTSFNIEF